MKTMINWFLECIHGILKIVLTGKAIERIMLILLILLAVGSFVRNSFWFLENIILLILFTGYIKFKGGNRR